MITKHAPQIHFQTRPSSKVSANYVSEKRNLAEMSDANKDFFPSYLARRNILEGIESQKNKKQ